MLCSRVENLLSAYCDCELTGEEMLRIRQHLSQCPSCHHEHQTVLQLKQLLGAVPAAEPPTAFRMELIEARLQNSYGFSGTRLQGRLHRKLADLTAPFRSLLPALSRVGLSSRRVTAGGMLVLAGLAGALIQRPQPPDAITAHVPVVITAERAPILPLPTPRDAAYTSPGLEPVYYQYYTGNQLTHVGPDDLMPWDGRVSASVNLVHWQNVQRSR